MITVGLDLSLVKTGYTIIQDDGFVLDSGVIKSSPSGDKPVDEVNRIVKILDDVMYKVHTAVNPNLTGTKPDLVIIEGLAFMAQGTSLVQLAGLNYLTRALLSKMAWPFLIVAPTTLKKFITGSGKGDKDQMMMAVYKNYAFEASDNNECDAYALAVCGLAVLGKPYKNVTKPQLEVINLLKKQL